jgi:hypothetical protein
METPRQPLTDRDVLCLGHLRKAFELLDALHPVGCERDRAGNRELHFDGYCKLVLLYVWNPLIGSVRTLQQAVGLDKVARAVGVRRFSLGSFSESVRVFDPERLGPIVRELARQVAAAAKPLSARDPRLASVEHAITLVDGTVLTGLTRLVRAACGAQGRYTTAKDGTPLCGWRLHTQLDLATFAPHRVDRTGARNAGANRENNVLRRTLDAGRCYVGDGTYADQSLFDDVTEAGSSFAPAGAGGQRPAGGPARSGCSRGKRWTRAWSATPWSGSPAADASCGSSSCRSRPIPAAPARARSNPT